MWCSHAKFTEGCKSCEESRTTKEQEIKLLCKSVNNLYQKDGCISIALILYNAGVRSIEIECS